jgi:glyoxylase-like metal-dependent hydrolase (beta-lactamase superfamily II)
MGIVRHFQSAGSRTLRLSFPFFSLLAFAVFLPRDAWGQDDLKINQDQITERVLVTWACDHFQGTNMAVVATAEGLVVIDTGLSPTTVARQRDLVEGVLGREDFRYLINTHMHNDHAFANQVFPDATVVGPATSVDALALEVERIPELLGRLRQSQASYEDWAASNPADSLESVQAREGVAAFAVGIGDLEKGIEPRYPTMTFDGRHSLDLGDVHLHLFEFAGLHSESDILILIQEEKMLFTGDVFWGGQLPVLRFEDPNEFQQLMDHWGRILQMSPDLEHVVPGHSDVPLTVAEFRGMYDYLSRLWEDVRSAQKAGTPLIRFLMQYVFAERYPEVADFTYIRRELNLHQHNIYVLWGLGEGG